MIMQPNDVMVDENCSELDEDDLWERTAAGLMSLRTITRA